MRISVVNEPAERWTPLIGHCFRMTLAPLQGAISSLSIELRAPGDVAPGPRPGPYTCEVRDRTGQNDTLRVCSTHEEGALAIAHAFARARREVRRRCLRREELGFSDRRTGDPVPSR